MTTKRNIIVVGASRGIGKSIVELLAKNPGYQIHAYARNNSRMEKQFGQLVNVKCYSIDLDSIRLREELEETTVDMGHIDVIINVAGYLVNKPFPELSHTDLTRSYQINVIGVMETIQAFLPKMNMGHIVNISSMGGFQGSVKFAGLAAYSTSKAALCSFTELFAEEYKNSGIKMNCLCLGAVQTEMLEEAFPGYEAPMGPDKMAEYIVDFALNADQYMNGKIIPVSLSTP